MLVGGGAGDDRGGRCAASPRDAYDKILEIMLLCGFYRTVSYLANGLALLLEDNAARFPA